MLRPRCRVGLAKAPLCKGRPCTRTCPDPGRDFRHCQMVLTAVGADAFIGPLGCDSHRARGAAPNPVGADCISARAQGAIPAAPKGPLV